MTPRDLDGPMCIESNPYRDERGFFAETYRWSTYAMAGITDAFLQCNHSRSLPGVVRGMHYQIGKGAAKLVRVTRGAIFDVCVDLRRASPTFGAWQGWGIDDRNMAAVYCPVGFAHGFCVVDGPADVLYMQSNYFDPDLERGIAFDDPGVGIQWPVANLRASARDASAPTLEGLLRAESARVAGAPSDLPF